MAEKNVFAWYTRLRQPEELYIRTLYALLLATEKELHHIFSGELPNGLSSLYKKFNAIVLEGRGMLDVQQAGLTTGTFTAMDTLNEGAHTAFSGFVTCYAVAKNTDSLPPNFATWYEKHLTNYCVRLNYIHDLFKAGKNKKDVRSAVIQLHRP